MALDSESFNRDLYDLLKVRGYQPVPLDSKNQRVPASQAADVIQFTFTKDGKDYGKAWISIDDASNVIVYYDEEQQESPSTTTPGVEYDDSWTGFLKHLKNWSQRRQLSFELSNKDRLGDDMRQRDYFKMKEKLGEGKKITEIGDTTKGRKALGSYLKKSAYDLENMAWDSGGEGFEDGDTYRKKFKRRDGISRAVDRLTKEEVSEGYYPMGKKASYNDAVPSVKIILQHNRALEEGEQRYRNVAKIFLENQEGERFLAPTTRPGIARVYARHIAEGGVPNDDKWNHIKSICEDYNKMAGFVRATRNGQFNESAQELVQEGINHYNSLRETLHKLTGHRGYQAYFESWTPALMEDELDESINELFVQEMVDPRIESAMPILSRLKKPVTEMSEVDSLAEWADGIINEKLDLEEEQIDELSPETMLKYRKKAADDADYADATGDDARFDKRVNGVMSANRLLRNKKTTEAANPAQQAAIAVNMKKQGKKSKHIEEARPMSPELRAAQKNLVDLASGKVRRREEQRKAAEKASKELDKMFNRKPKKPTLDQIWQEVEHAISNYFPDGDPTDYLNPYMEDNGLTWDDITRAAKKNGYKNLWDYWNTLAQDIEDDAYSDWLVAKRPEAPMNPLSKDAADIQHRDWVSKKNPQIRTRVPFMEEELEEVADKQGDDYKEWRKKNFNDKKTTDDIVKGSDTRTKYDLDEDLGPEQKRVGQLGPTEKVKNNNIGKLVGASESTEIDPELARIIEMAKFKR